MGIAEFLGLDSVVYEIKRFIRKPRQATKQALNMICVVLTAFVVWRCLMVTTHCEGPVVVVLSGSMEPGMYRGDILMLYRPATYEVGDIVVYQVPGRDIPIVHRVLSLHEKATGEVELLTKGDNNLVDDRGLYNDGQLWLNQEDIMGKAIAFVPKLGMVTIWLNDYPSLKVVLLGGLGILLMLGKDV
eukprot:Gregarina_sp_Poly_1__768@NODE_1183_length_4845_cov_142_002721_g813_i0_p4_GENE_NODE_1183_length_4845_cov_142_002721_g813_i0NODE_1183_length_4845_cov_142_002721_g813_i0_p4_ORF_typecomplete_len187_score21_69Peptidase_S24/PF00717_23/1_6e03Peptidase_S24/PF00717_23/2_8e13_NODE_1183_length_4845_cov_142_002721_g813_i032453805